VAEVTALDFSEGMLEKARVKFAGNPKVRGSVKAKAKAKAIANCESMRYHCGVLVPHPSPSPDFKGNG